MNIPLENNEFKVIPVKSLRQGVYYYRIISNGTNIKSDKVLILN